MTTGGSEPPSPSPDDGTDDGTDAGPERDATRRRLKGFGLHLIAYFGVMIVLVPVNFATEPENPWFVVPMIGWGSVLAFHVAYVMGLFRGLTGKRR